MSGDVTGEVVNRPPFSVVIQDRRVWTMLILGFSAGLPILLIFSTLSVWLKEAGMARSTVTFFSWAALGYSFKFVWAPLIDRMPLPVLTDKLGQRRSWLFFTQLAAAAAILTTGIFDPQNSLVITAIGAVMIGFTSASQDVVIDAYRIELAESDMQSLLTAQYITGYRIGMIVAGAGSLYIADWLGSTTEEYQHSAWMAAYAIMALLMVLNALHTLTLKEPALRNQPDEEVSVEMRLRFFAVFLLGVGGFIWGFTALAGLSVPDAGPVGKFFFAVLRFGGAGLAAFIVVKIALILRLAPREQIKDAWVAPITDFIDRYGKPAFLLLLLIGTYKIADIVMGAVANVFYVEAGYDKAEIATYSKFWGVIATIAGGYLGGFVAIRFGLIRCLLLGAVVMAASNLLFAQIALMEPDWRILASVITADNLAQGLAATALVAFLSSLTNIEYTATQYALFSSLMTLIPKVLAGYSGSMVDAVGYPAFFTGTAILGVPIVVLILLVARSMKDVK